MKKTRTNNPLYPGNTVWGRSPEWLERQKSYLDKNQGKEINRFSVFKEANNQWRWITLSSSAFRDQDKEIVSTKALYNDVIRADRDRDYGPLRWWHVKGVELGDCDFNMLHDHVLIESGTFKSAEIAKAIQKASDKLGVSIGFFHPISEPDQEGVFHNIRRFERSLLPRDIASNALTALVVKTKELNNMADVTQKLAELEGIVGKDLAAEILSNARLAEKSAIEGMIEYKSAKEDALPDDEEEVLDDEEMPEGLTEEEKSAWLKKKPKKEEEEMADEEAESEKETVILKRPKKQEEEQPQPVAQQPAQQAPPKPADYEKAESEPIAQQPAKAAVQIEEKADQPEPAPPKPVAQQPAPPKPASQEPQQEQEYEEVEMEEVSLPEVIGNMTIEEFGELLASALSEALMPYLQTVKEAKAELEKARVDLSVSVKETGAQDEEVAKLKEKVSRLSVALEKAAEKIADLSGDIPAVAKPYVASESDETIIEQTDSLKEHYPREDSFVDWLAQN